MKKKIQNKSNIIIGIIVLAILIVGTGVVAYNAGINSNTGSAIFEKQYITLTENNVMPIKLGGNTCLDKSDLRYKICFDSIYDANYCQCYELDDRSSYELQFTSIQR